VAQADSLTTWDAAADFSGNNNPNGVWSYGWFPTSNSNDFNYDTIYTYINSGYSGSCWCGPFHSANDQWYPFIAQNQINEVNPWGILPWHLWMHPGPDGEASVLRWTAPTAMVVSVVGDFTPGDQGIMPLAIYQDGNLNQPLWTGVDSGAYNFNVSVAQGDTLDFCVDVNTTYGFWCGSTGIDLAISETPEPGTLSLLGIGAVSLLAYAWRRRRRTA